ncbi:hypothetical protein KL86DPRO_10343 [uncultured delta proteobacterium]|uniref:Uncharacterized protein n=1 Tax=uncultured delta proteobacterium TaxID=34034 RepID=A0A212IYP8_9DELT|nr:hypothetical protein KL86DPRO_10343 [uncultured delta proteobacterium]
MSKTVLERVAAIATVLEQLAFDIEIIRKGTEALISALPKGCEIHRCVLQEQASALERISITLGMAQATAERLKKEGTAPQQAFTSPPACQKNN